MSRITELDTERWNGWVNSRPEIIKKVCLTHPPNLLYRIGTTGHRCTIYSYAEDGTLTVNVTGKYNYVAFSRQVFGIKPEDLTECDMPADDEMLGAVLEDPDEIREYLEGHKC